MLRKLHHATGLTTTDEVSGKWFPYGAVHDLAVSAHNNWVIAPDNLSVVPIWLSDALCRVATGGGFATRALYANDRETVFHAQRPVMITGIEDLATRGDLIDRSIVVHLPAIADTRRRAESELWKEFNEARPELFESLCTAVGLAINRSGSALTGPLPRLADFASWAAGAAPSFGCSAAEFATIYRREVAERSIATVEASALTRPLVRLALAGTWRGTASDLLYAVENIAGRGARRTFGWPKAATQFAGSIRRLAPNLRAVGVRITFEREKGTGRRLIELAVSDAVLAASLGWHAPTAPGPVQLGLIDPFGQPPPVGMSDAL